MSELWLDHGYDDREAGTPLARYTYTLGAAGNRTAVEELSGRTVNYGYDDL